MITESRGMFDSANRFLILPANTLFALFRGPHSLAAILEEFQFLTGSRTVLLPASPTADSSTENQTLFKDLSLSGNNEVVQDLPRLLSQSLATLIDSTDCTACTLVTLKN